ncbi:mobilome CxxCx(11)CxxC protein [Rhodococcus sp. 05-2254-6]|uniref:mobilome CxxCx(11)CxxC protein n=1 Tax=Rhodococcus sp. 05-2254-6 TaxID=2022489 RepID=UPI003593B675
MRSTRCGERHGDRALSADGTARNFELRAQRYNPRLKALLFAGFVVPIVVAGVAVVGIPSSALDLVLVISAILGTVQLLWSLWSLIDRWNKRERMRAVQ